MNEPATVSGVKMTVNSVEYRSSMSGVEVASPGQTYVVVDVTIQNIGTQSQPFDAKNFKFQYGSTGAEYDMTYATMQNPLDYGDLAPGATAEGQVTFLVATAPGHQYILWEPGKGLVKAVALIK